MCDFVYSFPLYFVVQDIGLFREPLIADSDDDGSVSVGVYTEEIQAERAKAKCRPEGYIIPIPDAKTFDLYLLQSQQFLRATRVAFDAFSNAGQVNVSTSIEAERARLRTQF